MNKHAVFDGINSLGGKLVAVVQIQKSGHWIRWWADITEDKSHECDQRVCVCYGVPDQAYAGIPHVFDANARIHT